ncbi:hypothetical protein TNCV_3497871 [Trichonephila clavipes]|nr:hypothetical protein TNCV_3497871 [Trichonephila clavipes]
MVDSITGGGLSAAVLGSSVPEVLEDFSTLLPHSEGVINMDELFKNGSKSDEVLKTFFLNSPEKRRMKSYIESMVIMRLNENYTLEGAADRCEQDLASVRCVSVYSKVPVPGSKKFQLG